METKSNTVLVTGGAGFTGSHLVWELLNLGNRVIVLDNLFSGKSENLPVGHKNLIFVKGSVLDSKLLRKLLFASDIVFHLAALIPDITGHAIKHSLSYPLKDFSTTVGGTLNILNLAKKRNLKMIFTSSAAVYGEPKKPPISEDAPLEPISFYGVSKLAAEMYCHQFFLMYDLPIRIGRIFNAYGPFQRKYVMFDILRKLSINPHELEILGTGGQIRDFIYVKDVAKALVLLSKDESNCNVYNIGSGIGTTIREVVDLINKRLDISPKVSNTKTSWKGDIHTLIADISKLKKLGFIPEYSLEKGLDELLLWFRNTYPSNVS